MTPPLSLWSRAVAMGSLFLALIAGGLAAGAPPSEAYATFNRERLQEFRRNHEPRNAQALRVVMLGNSRLKNATFTAEELTRLPGMPRIETYRLMANLAVFENFGSLLADIRALDPDVYVVQMDLLVYDFAPAFRKELALRYLRWLTAGDGPWTWYDPRSEQLDLACTDAQDPRKSIDLEAPRLVSDLDGEGPKLAHAFIRDVAARGAKVLLVSVPKTAAYERMLPSVTEEMLRAAQRLASELPSVTVAPYPGIFPDDHFCDIKHLNRKGGDAYVRWLAERLATDETAGLR